MDFFIFCFVTFIAILGILLAHAYGNLRRIQNSWGKYRCNPIYMPFAGIVDPSTGIQGNFEHCMNLIGKDVMGVLMDVMNSLLSVLSNTIKELLAPLDAFRGMFATMRKFVLSFTNTTVSKISGPVSAFSYTLIKLRDLLNRMVGEGTLAVFFGATAAEFMESFVILCFSVIKGFVIAMMALSVILALFQPEILAIVVFIASLLAAAL